LNDEICFHLLNQQMGGRASQSYPCELSKKTNPFALKSPLGITWDRLWLQQIKILPFLFPSFLPFSFLSLCAQQALPQFVFCHPTERSRVLSVISFHWGSWVKFKYVVGDSEQLSHPNIHHPQNS
jgi:hypothetical protein